ncbi:MAG: hypothetical protein L0Z50_29815 [Verrucomicrobiales bacterium]|nr:hypothetical protein [Verrucomicrobiales bacterium]
MTSRIRKFTLTTHVTVSVGWLGAVAAYLVLAITALTSRDTQMVRASFLSMELIGWFVIVPCSLAALLTGLVQSFATEWGLFRHYWILAKFILTVGGITILLMHMPVVSRMAGVAAETRLLNAALGKLPNATFVVHAGGGLLVLITATALSVYKPWGLTPYGRRRLAQPIPAHFSNTTPTSNEAGRTQSEPTRSTRWKLYLIIAIGGAILLFLVLHLVGGGLNHH